MINQALSPRSRMFQKFENSKIQKVKKSIQIVYYILIIAYQYVKNWIFIGNDMNFTFLITG